MIYWKIPTKQKRKDLERGCEIFDYQDGFEFLPKTAYNI